MELRSGRRGKNERSETPSRNTRGSLLREKRKLTSPPPSQSRTKKQTSPPKSPPRKRRRGASKMRKSDDNSGASNQDPSAQETSEERSESAENKSRSDEEPDPSRTLQQLLQRLGSGLGAEMFGAHAFGGVSRFKEVLENIKSDDPIKQTEGLTTLCDMLSMANESELGDFSTENFVPALVTLLNREDSPDIMLLACRALSHLVEAAPGTARAVVHFGAVPSFVSKLLTIEYIDLAEQSLLTLDKIATDHPQPIVRAGGLMGCLSYIDFFATGIQRIATSVAAKLCRQIPMECADMALDVVPNLISLLNYADQKIVENASLTLRRMTDSFSSSEERLNQIVDAGVLDTLLKMITPGSDSNCLNNEAVFHSVVSTVASLASGSDKAAVSILQRGFTEKLAELLSDGTTSSCEHTLELLNVASHLLPPLPGSHHAGLLYKNLTRASSVSAGAGVGGGLARLLLAEPPIPSPPVPAEKKSKESTGPSELEEALNMDPQLLYQMDKQLFQVLLTLFSTTVTPSVRYASLLTLSKMIHFSCAETLENVLKDVKMSSFFASLLTSKDWAVVLATIQMVGELMEKLPDIFSIYFQREGVVHELERVSKLPIISSPRASPVKAPKEGSPIPGITPKRVSELKALAIQKSKDILQLFAEKHASVQKTLLDLQELAKNLGSTDSFRKLASVLTGPDEVSSFEVSNSGVIEALVNALTHTTWKDEKSSERVHRTPQPSYDEVVARLRSFTNAMTTGDAQPLRALIMKTNEVLNISEHFPALVYEVSGRSSSSTVNALRMLTQPFRLRLQRAEGAANSSLADMSSNVVLVEPLAQIGAINDFLSEKVNPGRSGLGGPLADDENLSGQMGGASLGEEVEMAVDTTGDFEEDGSDDEGDLDDYDGDFMDDDIGYSDEEIDGDRLGQADGIDAAHRDADGVHEVTLPPLEASTTSTADKARQVDPATANKKVKTSSRRSGAPSSRAAPGRKKRASGRDKPTGDASTSSGPPSKKSAEPRNDAGSNSKSTKPRLCLTLNNFELQPHLTVLQAIHRYGTILSLRMNDSKEDELEQDKDAIADESGTAKTPEKEEPEESAKTDEPLEGDDCEDDEDGDVARVDRFMWNKTYTLTYSLPTKDSSTLAPASSTAANSSAPSVQNGNLRKDVGELPVDSLLWGVLPQPLVKLRSVHSALLLLRILYWVDNHTEHRPQLVDPSSFVNMKISSKVSRLLSDVLRICSGTFPTWVSDLVDQSPFLLPFDVRARYLQTTCFGLSRALHKLQEVAGSELTGSSGQREIRIARIQRQKVRITRQRVLESAIRVMELYATSRSMLEVEYFDEVGTGLGPTLEFYTLVAKELQKKSLNLWHESDASAGKDNFIHARAGLYPRPLKQLESSLPTPSGPPTKRRGEGIARALPQGDELWAFMGRFVAKALMDGRMVDMHLSPVFVTLVASGVDGVYDARMGYSGIQALCEIDPSLGGLLKRMWTLVETTKKIHADTAMSDAEKHAKCEALRFDGASISDLSLDFTLPGYQEFELKPDGANIQVTIHNLEEYIGAVVDTMLWKGIRSQVLAFRQGFSEVFPVERLLMFSSEEFDELLCGSQEAWSLEYLLESSKSDHGYSSVSPAVRSFLEILTNLNPQERVEFLKFATGSPRLPVGGLKNLNPKLTIVKRNPEEGVNVDSYLPTVMTCANYIKLPDYSSKDIMKERLLTAIKEGQGSFHLS
eukprot:Rmarinus@m.19562